ncbi:ATP synthase assembly factor Fmc1p, mitochondrial [[Candida] jaroonii]|uniref:ATP synthase assembly factor Fmc1p, mitochondrial n=1 Tax=[Candida] jaroonii TaxID=467808 RepID=A0ACA9Y3K5_9ASCO|nr:ATP synthase assembly factor Fmc1p, mitochondrial [[Candida] jaroonii]
MYKNILKELRIIATKTHKLHSKSQIKKEKALLEYKKYQLLKEGKPINEITQQIENLTTGGKPSDKFEQIFKQLHNEEKAKGSNKIKEANFNNIYTFLNSQRIYQELIERYNPGLTMDQTENIEASANRVGLKVPK